MRPEMGSLANSMHDIEMHEISEVFARCWRAACQHIQKHVQGPMSSWLKASLNPPFLEHLSFRLGNQLPGAPDNLPRVFASSDGQHYHF